MTIASADGRSTVDLVALYEQLRRHVLQGVRGVPGRALLQRHGMKGWIESCLSSTHDPPPRTPAVAHHPFYGEFVHLIAAMVLEIHQQGVEK